MKKKTALYRLFRLSYSYVLFFLAIVLVESCCIILLLKIMKHVVAEDNIRIAEAIVFGNTLFISLLATVFDKIRRMLTTDRTVKRIGAAAKQITRGDFSVRIEPVSTLFAAEHLNDIIDCFNTLAEELSGVETLRTDFIANVSHELKTPLAVIQNYGTLLQTPGRPEEKRNGIREVHYRGFPQAGGAYQQYSQAQQAGKPADIPPGAALRPGRAAVRVPAEL